MGRLGLVVLFLVLPLLSRADWCNFSRVGPPPPWAYDRGPDPNTPDGRALIDHLSGLPFMPGISVAMTGKQKFRPDFGSVVWRMTSDYPLQILFRGQDATHIAEAAGRTATAGFGGRAQDLAGHFGVSEGSGYWNAYQDTIRGQYGAFQSPFLYFRNGKPEVRFTGFVDNHLWMMTHQGPHAAWTNKFTELMIQQHPELKLMVLFGGASRDSTASFVANSPNGAVGTRYTEKDMPNILVPEMELKFAGGNNEFPVVLGQKGEDLYAEFLGRKLDYSKPADQKAALEAIQGNVDWFLHRMVFSKGGPYGNGIIDPAQLGGYDVRKMSVNGQPTLSLKGLQLSDGSVVDHDILVLQLPHPSALSRQTKEKASQQVGAALAGVEPYVAAGWKIEPDPGKVSHFNEGKPYLYGRADIGPEFYDFGAPRSRMVSVSTASRMPGAPWGIIFGTRDRARFDTKAIEAIRQSKPSDPLDPKEIWTSHQRSPDTRYVFDSGPGEKWAKLMKENLDLDALFKPKPGKSWKEDGIAAYNVKNHPDTGDFGHYRGTFDKPRVLVLSDPQGVDDLITSRAMTGARGQYLHGIMNDVGVGDQYLVLKTVPFRMDGATDAEWNKVLEQTKTYREKILRELLKEHQPEVIIADGPKAKAELQRILGKDSPIVVIQRGHEADYGIKAAGKEIARRLGSEGPLTGQMKDIPRSHLPFYSRQWEGRGGDHVLTATDKNEGQAFAVIAPEYATNQKVELDENTKLMVEANTRYLRDQGLRLPGESIPHFLERTQGQNRSLASGGR